MSFRLLLTLGVIVLASSASGLRAGEKPAAPTTQPVVFAPPADGREAKKIVFVIDNSGSMSSKIQSLQWQMRKKINSLAPNQSFNILMIQEGGLLAMGMKLIPADDAGKRQASDFIGGLHPRGETNPVPAMEAAFELKPDLIYLLTDGDFPDNDRLLQTIRKLNKDHAVKINTIAYVGPSDTDTEFMKLLKQIAGENGGVYTHINVQDIDP